MDINDKGVKILFPLFSTLIIIWMIYYILSFKKGNSNHPILNIVKQNFILLNPEYGKIPLFEGDSAYTENKSVITLCLKDKDTGEEYNINTIMYVALHELTHVICKSTGHGDEFKKNFANMLRQAASLNIYDPRIPIPSNYCGVKS